MKNYLILLFLLITTLTFGQNKYISTGISYSGQQTIYQIETGYLNENFRLGTILNTSKDSTNKYSTYGGIKIYYSPSHLTKQIDLATYTGLYISFMKNHPLQFEPGIALIYNVSNKLSIQWNISAPIYENIPLVNPSTGISVNYFLK
jgi:hypothetical protein